MARIFCRSLAVILFIAAAWFAIAALTAVDWDYPSHITLSLLVNAVAASLCAAAGEWLYKKPSPELP